jgi:CRP-like cAMP-binding protein
LTPEPTPTGKLFIFCNVLSISLVDSIIFIICEYKEKDSETETPFLLLRENISALSGISPESVSRNLTDFKEEGLIETYNGKIKILDMKKFESIKN